MEMKKFLSLIFLTCSLIAAASIAASAQRSPQPAIDRDPLLEADATHNLDVARQGFSPLKKAYKQVIYRFEETYAAYPDFSKMDEFLYLAGMSSYYLAENKGKQKIDFKNDKEKVKFAPEKLRKDAVNYLTQVVEKYPQSTFAADAKKTLDELKAGT